MVIIIGICFKDLKKLNARKDWKITLLATWCRCVFPVTLTCKLRCSRTTLAPVRYNTLPCTNICYWSLTETVQGLGVQFDWGGIEKEYKDGQRRAIVCGVCPDICYLHWPDCDVYKPGKRIWTMCATNRPMRTQARNYWPPIGWLGHTTRQTNYWVMSPPDGITLR